MSNANLDAALAEIELAQADLNALDTTPPATPTTAKWPAVKFVDAPATTANVRLDLSTSSVYVSPEGFSLGVPSFEGDPGSVGVEYGYRELSLVVRVTGSKTAALAVLQTLARELLRTEGNWLLFQLQPTSAPVWFKTYRGQPGDLSLEAVYDQSTGQNLPDRWDIPGDVSYDDVYGQSTGQTIPDLWEITVPLSADGFAWGARVTHAVATVSNNPAAATNPCFLTMPAIKGDAPAPARIAASVSATLDQSDIMWSIAPVPATYTAPIVWPIGTGDGATAGTDTGAAVSNSAYSGGSYRPITFATNASMVTRLTGSAPAAVPVGRYLVMMRVARSDTASTFAMRFGYTGLGGADIAGSKTVTLDRGTSTTAGYATWANMGVFSFPKFLTDLDVPGFNFAPGYVIQAQRLSGGGQLHLDAIMLVPVELKDAEGAGRTLFSRFHAFGLQSGDQVAYWDGDTEAFTRVNGFGVVDSGVQPSALDGEFPMVHPGQTNVLHVLQQTRLGSGYFGTLDNSDAISRSTTVTASYHPRYLYLRGD